MPNREDNSLHQFLADLESAVILYQGDREPTNALRAWMATLTALRTFLKVNNAPPSTIFLIMELTAALNDVFEGNESPHFAAKKKRGRPSQPTIHRIQWAISSALMDMLVDSGMSQEEAAKKLVDQMYKYNWPIPPQTTKSERPDWSRLRKKRERIRSNAPGTNGYRPNDIERQFYDIGKKDIVDFLSAGASPDTIIDYYFKRQLAKPKPQ